MKHDIEDIVKNFFKTLPPLRGDDDILVTVRGAKKRHPLSRAFLSAVCGLLSTWEDMDGVLHEIAFPYVNTDVIVSRRWLGFRTYGRVIRNLPVERLPQCDRINPAFQRFLAFADEFPPAQCVRDVDGIWKYAPKDVCPSSLLLRSIRKHESEYGISAVVFPAGKNLLSVFPDSVVISGAGEDDEEDDINI